MELLALVNFTVSTTARQVSANEAEVQIASTRQVLRPALLPFRYCRIGVLNRAIAQQAEVPQSFFAPGRKQRALLYIKSQSFLGSYSCNTSLSTARMGPVADATRFCQASKKLSNEQGCSSDER